MEVSNATSLRQSGITILQSSVTGEAELNAALATDVIALCSKKNPNVLKNLFAQYYLNAPAKGIVMNLLHRSSTLTPTEPPCVKHTLFNFCVCEVH